MPPLVAPLRACGGGAPAASLPLAVARMQFKFLFKLEGISSVQWKVQGGSPEGTLAWVRQKGCLGADDKVVLNNTQLLLEKRRVSLH